jgi:hypothetical protein
LAGSAVESMQLAYIQGGFRNIDKKINILSLPLLLAHLDRNNKM